MVRDLVVMFLYVVVVLVCVFIWEEVMFWGFFLLLFIWYLFVWGFVIVSVIVFVLVYFSF